MVGVFQASASPRGALLFVWFDFFISERLTFFVFGFVFVTRQAWQIRKDKLKEFKKVWVEDEDMPPPGVKVSAASRGPNFKVRGTQHNTCPEKQLREKRNHKRNQLKKMEAKWEAGGEWVDHRERGSLQAEVEELCFVFAFTYCVFVWFFCFTLCVSTV